MATLMIGLLKAVLWLDNDLYSVEFTVLTLLKLCNVGSASQNLKVPKPPEAGMVVLVIILGGIIGGILAALVTLLVRRDLGLRMPKALDPEYRHREVVSCGVMMEIGMKAGSVGAVIGAVVGLLLHQFGF